MKTPAFWFRPPGLAARILHPLACVYEAAGQLRRRSRQPVRVPVPLIVVGNVVAGGAGKTPVVLSLASLLQKEGRRVHLIARGYGGKRRGPEQVDPARHTALDVGDEPLLLAQVAPTFIGVDRGATLKLAADGADVIISDDGLQNPRLAATLGLLVMDGVMGTGNGRIIPAGPLREPLREAMKRVQAVIQIGGSAREYDSKPVLMADFVPIGAGWLRGARVLAFAGIGQPEKFFATLTTCGAHLVAALPFADHQPYTETGIRRLIAMADAHDAIPVTTAKDSVRIPWNLRDQVRIVSGELRWRDPARMHELLNGMWKQP